MTEKVKDEVANAAKAMDEFTGKGKQNYFPPPVNPAVINVYNEYPDDFPFATVLFLVMGGVCFGLAISRALWNV